jgi:membrane protein DedA with SNARE-associated domain
MRGYRGRVSEEPLTAAESRSPEPQAAPEAGETGEAKPVSPWENANLPWSGKPGRADVICWAAIVLSGFYYLALLPFRATLVGTHPLLGTFLNGATESIVSAAAFARVGHGSIPVVILVAIPGLMKFDLLYWWAGRLWGERVVALLSGRRKAGAKAIARARQWGRWFTWPAVVVAPFLPIPSAIFYVVAGLEGMSAVTFLILDLIGELAWIGLLVGLGYELGHRAVSVAQTISHYGLWVSLGIVALVFASQLRSVRMHR